MIYPQKSRQCFIVLGFLLFSIAAIVKAVPSSEQIRREILSSMVVIRTEFGTRSGFFVTDNLVVTNYHAIHGVSEATVREFSPPGISSGKSDTVQSAAAVDIEHDLAILRVNFNAPSLSISTNADYNTTGYIVGNVSEGEGSGKIFDIDANNRSEFLLKTWIVNKSCGGPVLNKNKEVIGVSVRGIPLSPIKLPISWATKGQHLSDLIKKAKKSEEQPFPLKHNLNSWVSMSWINMRLESGLLSAEEAINEYNESSFSHHLNRAMARYEARKFTEALNDLARASDTSTCKRVFKAFKVVSRGFATAQDVLKVLNYLF